MAVSVMQGWIVVALEIFLGSLVLMLLLALVAAYRLGRIWRDDPPSARRLRVERMLFAPRFWKPVLRGRISKSSITFEIVGVSYCVRSLRSASERGICQPFYLASPTR